MNKNLPILELKPINDLLEEKFFIPSYQRGYRWTPSQVKELLNDIWEFRTISEDQSKNAFYCLQPVVVTRKNASWEIIDGQQRLTTIYLILTYLKGGLSFLDKEKYSIRYETRPDSGEFLKHIDHSKKNENIDYYHITTAFEAIEQWFSDRDGTAKINFLTTLLNDRGSGKNVQVIWYEVSKKDAHPVEIFTRINIGKIPLTNAELIKALLLGKVNSGQQNDEDWVHLKRLQIAGEWDQIENSLQNDSFWYFIDEEKEEYDTRIEFIFDLMKEKGHSVDPYYTFHAFIDDFQEDDIDTIWLEVKKHFQTLQEWYYDREFYHWIGYLVASGSTTVSYLIKESKEKTKTEFKKRLKEIIKNKLAIKESEIDELEYDSDKQKIKLVLLLFNVQTMLSNTNSNRLFPFDQFKKENWDIEHVRSVTSDKPTGASQRKWLEIILEYFTGTQSVETENKFSDLDHTEKKFVKIIRDVLSNQKITEEIFTPVFDDVLEFFKEENDPENINAIDNLTLLDSSTNRSYKNAPFPVKRKFIMNRDMFGGFVPPCTKNVFMKAYSKRFDNAMFWQESDAIDYLNVIKNTLNDFIIKEN